MDIFTAVQSTTWPASIKARPDHPLPPAGISADIGQRHPGPLQTNKFYSNLLLHNQDLPVYVLPYSVSWTNGRGPSNCWGLTVSYATPEQRTLGPTTGPCNHSSRPSSYFYSPPIQQSLVLDAAELDHQTTLTIENPTDMSVMLCLRSRIPTAPPAIQFPLVQGQGFITGLYAGARPVIRSAQAILSMQESENSRIKPNQRRYVLQMSGGATWLVYITSRPGSAPLELRQAGQSVVEAKHGFCGSIQVAQVLNTAQDWAVYDATAGVFCTGVRLLGNVQPAGQVGTYEFAFTKSDVTEGNPAYTGSPLLMFALPHHLASFDGRTRAAVQYSVAMETPVKGTARAVVADFWTMVEPALPVSMGFLPWDPHSRETAKTLSPAVRKMITQVARQELSQDMEAQCDLESAYFAGKALAKFALTLLCAADLLDDRKAAADGLARLKTSFARFAEGRQKHPWVYEATWGGVVSSAAYTSGDPMADFGNSYYNDHHFHYGYFVLAGAIIAHLDRAWLPAHAPFVDLLVRDYANASSRDVQFPVFRSFDWYHGHSWASGVFPSMDGKNQESSSEDAMALYAIKMWGHVRGDTAMEARGNLMLSVLARSLQTYYYYSPGQTELPAAFVGNQVGGIMFENKIDHTTFFGGDPELIHGIHMLPLLPCSPLCRPPAYVMQEWHDTFSEGRADRAQGGWRGVLYGNLATASPKAAFAWFSQSNFKGDMLDQGASQTWYLCYSAGR
ncbi:endo-1,3-beta glucanase [Sporothrix epigloea]|uniref:glucan endo-1,3-beta-D-glucosidase n=1 Tax=Sporothrix epigloea TaxID=1892477 RepID=A0ABP0D9G4_9PEZI